MRVLLRHLGTADELEPGQYTTETASGGVAVACPGCGFASDLDQTPLGEGTVPLVWRCPYERTCGWEGLLKLESWGDWGDEVVG